MKYFPFLCALAFTTGCVSQPPPLVQYPEIWRSVQTGSLRSVRVYRDRVVITNLLSAEERAEGDFGEGLLIPHDGTYTGTFSERSTCTSDDNTKHHCDLATPFEITVLTPSRIEGRGRYPKVETFDCAACTFSDDWEDFTFVWLPSAEN